MDLLLEKSQQQNLKNLLLKNQLPLQAIPPLNLKERLKKAKKRRKQTKLNPKAPLRTRKGKNHGSVHDIARVRQQSGRRDRLVLLDFDICNHIVSRRDFR